MIHQRVSLEMKVGAFVVTGVALLIFFLFAIGDLATFFQPGYGLRVEFDSANGISTGSPVQYAGIEVGKVEEVRLVYPKDRPVPQIQLLIRLPRRVQVRTDDEAAISTFGLLGEKYLEIRPGPGQGAALKAGELLPGKPTVSTERVIERSNEVLTELKRTLEGLNQLVGDPEAQLYLKETLQEDRDAMRNWKILGERLNLAMSHAESGEGNLGKMVYDDELYQRALALMDDLQRNPWKLLVRQRNKSASSTKTSSSAP